MTSQVVISGCTLEELLSSDETASSLILRLEAGMTEAL